MDFSKLCTPAMVYLVLAAISLVIALFKNFEIMSLVAKGIFIVAWTWFLNFLCSKGYKAISWFLVLLPFLLMLGIFVMAMEVVKKASASMMPPTQGGKMEGMKKGGPHAMIA